MAFNATPAGDQMRRCLAPLECSVIVSFADGDSFLLRLLFLVVF